jgi:hypothetical protein
LKITYDTVRVMNLYNKKAEPGDELSLVLRNEHTDGMYAQAERLYYMFVLCYGFFPDSIAIHPDHLALLKKMGKRLDILIDEKMAQEIGKSVDLATLPRAIALVADESLDLFTSVARYTLDYEQAGDMAMNALFNRFGIER